MNEPANTNRVSDEVLIEIIHGVKDILIKLIDQAFNSEIRRLER